VSDGSTHADDTDIVVSDGSPHADDTDIVVSTGRRTPTMPTSS
jgi:hypothetical protein